MKNKSILIVIALCAGLQSGAIFGETWNEWGRRIFGLSAMQSRAKERNPVGLMGAAGGVVGAGLTALATMDERINIVSAVAAGAYAGYMVSLIVDQAMKRYLLGAETRFDAIEIIKSAIRAVLSNKFAYPTKASRLQALYPEYRNEFVGYVEDPYGVVQEACDQLIQEINAEKLTTEQDMQESKIDLMRAEIESSLANYLTLQDRIAALEQAAGYPLAIAHTSELLRLKNRLAVEQKAPDAYKRAQGRLRGSAQLTPQEEQQQQQMRHKVLENLERLEHNKRMSKERTRAAAEQAARAEWYK